MNTKNCNAFAGKRIIPAPDNPTKARIDGNVSSMHTPNSMPDKIALEKNSPSMGAVNGSQKQAPEKSSRNHSAHGRAKLRRKISNQGRTARAQPPTISRKSESVIIISF